MLQRMKMDPVFLALCTHVIKMSVIHLYIRKDVNTSTNISKDKYLDYCKAINTKKLCVGLHSFVATMNSRLPEIIDENFVNSCVHALIETMYVMIYSVKNHTYSIFVECIMSILDHNVNIVYMDEIYEASQNQNVDIRSRYLLLNTIDLYFKKMNRPVPKKYT